VWSAEVTDQKKMVLTKVVVNERKWKGC